MKSETKKAVYARVNEYIAWENNFNESLHLMGEFSYQAGFNFTEKKHEKLRECFVDVIELLGEE